MPRLGRRSLLRVNFETVPLIPIQTDSEFCSHGSRIDRRELRRATSQSTATNPCSWTSGLSGVDLAAWWVLWLKLAGDYDGKAVVGKVNVDHNSDISQRFGIRNIPTILFLKNGEVVDKSVGAVPKNVLAEKLDALL